MISYECIKVNMNLSKKFIITLLLSICFIALANIAAFKVFYNSYIKLYLSEKIEQKSDITIEEINSLIERETLWNLDEIFSDTEIEFFELLDLNNGKIPLKDRKNTSIVIDFLIKSGVSPSLIEDIIPDNNLEKVLTEINNPNSAESRFIERFSRSMILFNIALLSIVFATLFFIIRRIIGPINDATERIQNMELWKKFNKINYAKNDEIGLLIWAINKLNTKLSLQENIRSRLLADISHELKTPITSIQCYLEGISDGIIKLDDKTLNGIILEMQRLVKLVNRIMDFEKFENSEVKLKKESINPHETVSEIITPLRKSLQENNQRVRISWSKNIEILADRELFIQLVYNLVGNFRKYAGENTTFNIKITSKNIVFSDNWVWIDKKELPYLQDKFYQGKKEKSWDAEERWIWVGLSIIARIISLHNWKSEITSDAWKGFSFSLFF